MEKYFCVFNTANERITLEKSLDYQDNNSEAPHSTQFLVTVVRSFLNFLFTFTMKALWHIFLLLLWFICHIPLCSIFYPKTVPAVSPILHAITTRANGHFGYLLFLMMKSSLFPLMTCVRILVTFSNQDV